MLKQAIEPTQFHFFDYKRYSFSLGLKAEDAVWVSGQSGIRYDGSLGRMVIGSSIREQTESAHAKIATILREAGLTERNIVKINDYVPRGALGSYEEALHLRERFLNGARPAVSTVVVDRLLREGAMLEVEVIASAKAVLAIRDDANDRVGRSAAVRVGKFVYVSGIMDTSENDGQKDLVVQTDHVFQSINRVLLKAGVSTRQIVKTVDFLREDARRDYRRTAEVRRKYLTEPFPASTGVVVSQLPYAHALIQIDAIAFDGPRELMDPGGNNYKSLTFSPAIRAGNLIFLSGQFAMDQHTLQPVCPDDVVGQANYIYGSLLRLLEAAGTSARGMVKTTEYLVADGLRNYGGTAEVRRNMFPAPWPTATGVVINRLLRQGMLLEVDALAVAP